MSAALALAARLRRIAVAEAQRELRQRRDAAGRAGAQLDAAEAAIGAELAAAPAGAPGLLTWLMAARAKAGEAAQRRDQALAAHEEARTALLAQRRAEAVLAAVADRRDRAARAERDRRLQAELTELAVRRSCLPRPG